MKRTISMPCVTDRDGAVRRLVAGAALLAAASAAFGAEREITFKGVDGIELKGTLTVPDKAEMGKTKALLLLPGSGPTDRDGNQRPGVVTDLLKTVAGRLEAEGIATLRFDKRAAMRYVASFPKDFGSLGDFFSFENFIGDAEAALEYLRAQQEVDASKTGVLGHSEGALITLKMTQGKNPPPFIALMGCPGRPLGEVMANQFDDGMVRQGMPTAEREPLMKALRESLAEFKSSGKIPGTVPEPFKKYFPSHITKYLYSALFFDPAPLAAAYQGPTLLLHGEKDIQILAGKDAAALRKAFEHNPGFTYREFSSLSHNFKAVNDPDKETGFGGPVPAEVLNAIAEWMGKR